MAEPEEPHETEKAPSSTKRWLFYSKDATEKIRQNGWILTLLILLGVSVIALIIVLASLGMLPAGASSSLL
jgi:hypothetical protein